MLRRAGLAAAAAPRCCQAQTVRRAASVVPQYRRLSTQAEGDALAAPSWAIGRARSTDEQAGTLDKLMARGEQFVLFCKLTMLERNEVIDFQAGEFVLGAAHARRHVYELVSTGDYSDLSDTLSASAINTLRDVAMQNPERFLDPMLTNTRLLFADATCVAEPLDTSPTGQQVHTLGMKVQFLKQDAAMREEGFVGGSSEPSVHEIESVWSFERQVELSAPVVVDERMLSESADGDWQVTGVQIFPELQ